MFRHERSAPGGWDENFQGSEEKAKVEVGVFVNEKPVVPKELSLGGFQAIVGKDRKPSRKSSDVHTCIDLISLSQIRLDSHSLRAITQA